MTPNQSIDSDELSLLVSEQGSPSPSPSSFNLEDLLAKHQKHTELGAKESDRKFAELKEQSDRNTGKVLDRVDTQAANTRGHSQKLHRGTRQHIDDRLTQTDARVVMNTNTLHTIVRNQNEMMGAFRRWTAEMDRHSGPPRSVTKPRNLSATAFAGDKASKRKRPQYRDAAAEKHCKRMREAREE